MEHHRSKCHDDSDDEQSIEPTEDINSQTNYPINTEVFIKGT